MLQHIRNHFKQNADTQKRNHVRSVLHTTTLNNLKKLNLLYTRVPVWLHTLVNLKYS